ncbi:Bifunctional ligase/repressor BirA [Seminavis robusta]|uniref:Bifunctional ligase/repressor BirA n=1 Tax=Seminavis robusta TaxID=568900 RepID=A0A9N8DGY7_9STRA|nr:Bifunctional ligase/repressor BirA [Seminavis robusta]|eukprot:Sro154_g069960.1 Bifunctional ligase/repressor BirA (332) ;mRNA; f:33684-34679
MHWLLRPMHTRHLHPLLALSLSVSVSVLRTATAFQATPTLTKNSSVAPMTTVSSSSNNNESSTCSSDPQSRYADILDFHVLQEPIGSTQDETKRLLQERHNGNNNNSSRILAVLAKQQENGRGTQGRKWEGRQGNVYLTMAVPFPQIPVTITLLPLQIGVLIAHTLQEFDKNNHKITVKWPNDVLVEDRKIAGVLIENWLAPAPDRTVWLVIGIGINIAYAPVLPEGIRPAICLQEMYKDNTLPESTSQEVGTHLVYSLLDWLEKGRTSNNKALMDTQVLQEWKALAKFGQVYKIRETGEEVVTLGVQNDGQLKVRGANGRERSLTADYLH